LPDTHGVSLLEHLAKLTGSGTRDLIRSAGRMRYVRLAIRFKGTSLPPGYRELKQT
jgi:hypothetical protein